MLQNGNLECLKYAHENGGILTENTFQIALENYKTECIKYLVENNCPIDKFVSIMAVNYCDLEIIKYLCEKNVMKLDDDYVLKHAIHNKLSITKYILDKGCAISSDIMILLLLLLLLASPD